MARAIALAALVAIVMGAKPVPAARLPGTLQPLGAAGTAAAPNERPIIGVLSQPGSPAPKGSSYIAASYVKWLEAAGARVVPILYDMSEGEVRDRFYVINGLLLPGGGADLSPGHPFFDTARLLVDLAVVANDAGDYFPVHGTCLGLETLALVVSRNYSLLADMEAEDAPAPLLYTADADSSRLLRSLPQHVVRNLQDGPIVFENHRHGVLMTAYDDPANAKLSDFFKVLALSLDTVGQPYISLMEGRKYPMWATQFHPEKASFEWARSLHIPHSRAAIELGQELANFFVGQARRNTHAARDAAAEDALLIYNHAAHFTGRRTQGGQEQDFEQCYFFEGAAGGGAAAT